MTHGIVKFEGQKITLVEEAYMTNRCIGGSDQIWITEYQAEGRDESGSRAQVFWRFSVARNGYEPAEFDCYPYETLEEDYDWDDVYNVEPDPWEEEA